MTSYSALVNKGQRPENHEAFMKISLKTMSYVSVPGCDVQILFRSADRGAHGGTLRNWLPYRTFSSRTTHTINTQPIVMLYIWPLQYNIMMIPVRPLQSIALSGASSVKPSGVSKQIRRVTTRDLIFALLGTVVSGISVQPPLCVAPLISSCVPKLQIRHGDLESFQPQARDLSHFVPKEVCGPALRRALP